MILIYSKNIPGFKSCQWPRLLQCFLRVLFLSPILLAISIAMREKRVKERDREATYTWKNTSAKINHKIRTHREEMSQYSTPCTIQYHSKLADFNGFHWLPWIYNMDIHLAAGQSSANCVTFHFFFSINDSGRQRCADDHEKKATTEVWTENLGLQASSHGNNSVCSHPTKLPLWSFKSNKLLYKGTTYKTVKYITF